MSAKGNKHEKKSKIERERERSRDHTIGKWKQARCRTVQFMIDRVRIRSDARHICSRQRSGVRRAGPYTWNIEC